jgi:hypothetical protein
LEVRILSSYDCASWKTSRCDQDKDQFVLSAALSIMGAIQPKVLCSVFTQMNAENGLLPRFTFIFAKCKNPPLMNEEEFTGQTLLEKIAAHLLDWKMNTNDNQTWPQKIRLSPAVYGCYRTWNHTLTMRTWRISEIDRVIVPKVVSLTARLALLSHALKAAFDGDDGLSDLSVETMEGAVKFGDWIYAHQKHIWVSLGIENQPITTPLDEAVMRVGLSLEEFLKENDWRVSNNGFNSLVQRHLDRAAARLGIKTTVNIGKKRGKEFSNAILERFRAASYF